MKKLPRALPYTNYILNWVILGMEFGYPPCCIGEFVIWAIKSDKEIAKRSSRKLCGTGYVPCVKCNEKSDVELIAEINERRSSDLEAFPNANRKQSA